MALGIQPPPTHTAKLDSQSQQWRTWWLQVQKAFAVKLDTVKSATPNHLPMFNSDGGVVDSNKAVPSGDVVGTSDTQTLTDKTLTTPTLDKPDITDFTSAVHSHANAAGGGQLKEGALSLSDVTTNNSTANQHGFLPRLSGNANEVLLGDGSWGAMPTPSIILTSPDGNKWELVVSNAGVVSANAVP